VRIAPYRACVFSGCSRGSYVNGATATVAVNKTSRANSHKAMSRFMGSLLPGGLAVVDVMHNGDVSKSRHP
jgi:hypothetical protein